MQGRWLRAQALTVPRGGGLTPLSPAEAAGARTCACPTCTAGAGPPRATHRKLRPLLGRSDGHRPLCGRPGCCGHRRAVRVRQQGARARAWVCVGMNMLRSSDGHRPLFGRPGCCGHCRAVRVRQQGARACVWVCVGMNVLRSSDGHRPLSGCPGCCGHCCAVRVIMWVPMRVQLIRLGSRVVRGKREQD